MTPTQRQQLNDLIARCTQLELAEIFVEAGKLFQRVEGAATGKIQVLTSVRTHQGEVAVFARGQAAAELVVTIERWRQELGGIDRPA